MKSAPTFLAALVLTMCMMLPAAASPHKPNVVFILADDLGYADLSCYGAADLRTPRLDELAAEGVRFTHFYANGPECTPTRTALLTGRYQQRVGGLECAIGIGGVGRYDDAIRLAARGELGLPSEQAILPRRLKQAGYATAIIGKWHLGYEDKFSPMAAGFDHALYCLGGGMDYFHHVEPSPELTHVLRLDGRPVRRDGEYFTSLIAEEAASWLAAHHEQPFFLYLPFTAPHSPFQGPDDREPAPLPLDSMHWQQSKADPAVYAAMIESLDAAVGRVLDQLEELGVADRTLVVFVSDNGGTQSARPFGLRGYKGSTFEGGIRVPCIVRWPGVIQQGTACAYPALTFDLSASLLRAAGGIPGKDVQLDGIDILDHVASQTPPPDRDLFWRQRRGERTWRAVREGSLKLVVERNGERKIEHLFDIAADPAEERDLAGERPGDLARLRDKLKSWELAVKPAR